MARPDRIRRPSFKNSHPIYSRARYRSAGSGRDYELIVFGLLFFSAAALCFALKNAVSGPGSLGGRRKLAKNFTDRGVKCGIHNCEKKETIWKCYELNWRSSTKETLPLLLHKRATGQFTDSSPKQYLHGQSNKSKHEAVVDIAKLKVEIQKICKF